MSKPDIFAKLDRHLACETEPGTKLEGLPEIDPSEGYDFDRELASSLLHDQGNVNDYVEQHVSAEEIAKVRDVLIAMNRGPLILSVSSKS